MNNQVIITVRNDIDGKCRDILVDTSITADELIQGLKSAYGGDYSYLICENPPAFLSGKRQLSQYSIHNASVVIFGRR